MKSIAIFASGNGTNAQALMEHFAQHHTARISLVITENSNAHVLQRAINMGVPAHHIPWGESFAKEALQLLEKEGVEFIVLAGFLKLIPAEILAKFPRRIINLHPALLPNYGGKGMYGERVHRAVIAAGEPESGITIHYADSSYDTGGIIAQFRCPVLPEDTPASLAARIHTLEHLHLPEVTEKLVLAL